MAEQGTQSLRRPDGYFQRTRYPLNSLAFLAPLLIVFHLGAARTGTDLLAPHLIGKFLGYFGATADVLPPLLIVGVLLIQHALAHKPWRLQPFTLAGMVAESIIWTIPLIALNQLTGRLVLESAPAAQAASAEAPDLLGRSILAVGAGIYEEFLFRLVLISLVMLIFADALGLKKQLVAAAALVIGSIIFGLCHFPPGAVDPAKWSKFAFLAIAGLLWGCVYLYRGFGITVGAHIFWDLYVAFY